MPSPDIITAIQLSRRIGLPDAPALLDIRSAEDFTADPRALPCALRASHTDVAAWGVYWSHRGPLCTFDVMIAAFGVSLPALDHLALLVRGADTADLSLAPEAVGLLAASLGLSRMHRDDLAQLDAGLALYDAFFRWCRDAAQETHNWPKGSPA